ncbi:MAG TPA: amidohydrolase family protein, partial [Burkholderiales bacterium]
CVPFQLAMSRLAERGEFPSPRMITISPPIDGVDANGRTDMPRGVAMTDVAQAKPLVERFAGYRQIKAFSLLTPDNLRALVHASPVPVTANCPNAMTFEQAVDAGVYCLDQLHNVARGHLRSDARQPGFWDRFDPVPGTRLDFGAIRELARFLAEKQTWNVPTLVFHQRDALAPEEGMRDPALKYVSPSAIKDWESTLIRWTRRARMDDVGAWRRAAAERARAFQEVLAIFHDAGVPLLTGSDSLNPWNVPGASLHAELANFVAAGMTPYQALRCATSEVGRFLGDGSGTLGAGKRADLLLTRSNPLRDLRALQEIEAVAVNGYYLPRAELDRLLSQRAALVSAPARLPSSALPNAKVWQERIVGAEAGSISFRHSRLPDGGLQVEERHAAAVPRKHVERRHSRLVLDADFKLRSCEYSIDSFAGTERGAISRSPEGYELEAQGLDGRESRHAIKTESLLPSERLTVTLWPLLLQRAGQARMLDVEDGVLVVREVLFKDGELKVSRPTHVTEQRYRFADGKFLGMEETMPLLWLRELLPA